MPTTSRLTMRGCLTWFGVTDGTSAPEVAVKLTWVPTAPAGEANPSACASLSVSTISLAASELGSRPARSAGTALDDAIGGSDTRTPAGTAAALFLEPATDREPPTLYVPLMPTSPHAARTCCRWASTPSVAASNVLLAAPATG